MTLKHCPQAREGHTCNYKPKDSQTMHAWCCLSRGCFPGCRGVKRRGAHTPGWTNWFVPSGIHLERGHCYGMHTSPGGCWCHCGTCLLHSQPLSAAQIYLHSPLFCRELCCKQQRIVLCQSMEYVSAGSLILSSFLGFMNAPSLADHFFFIPFY